MPGHVLQPRDLSRCLPPGPALATPLGMTRPPLPRGRAPSDTQRQIFKWRSLILTIQRPFVTRRLNKDEMEFLCHVTNRGKGSGNKHENMRSISDRMGKCLSESATFSCLSKRFRSCQALSSWTHTNEEYSVYNWFE